MFPLNCANLQVTQLAPCLKPPAEGETLVGPVGASDGGGVNTLLGGMVVDEQQKKQILLSTSAGSIFIKFPQKLFETLRGLSGFNGFNGSDGFNVVQQQGTNDICNWLETHKESLISVFNNGKLW